jgi:hypothetical protein
MTSRGKFGQQIYGLKYAPFTSRLITKESSLGIISLNEDSMAQGYACYVSKNNNTWNISSTHVPSRIISGTRVPPSSDNRIALGILLDLPSPIGGINTSGIPF